MMPMLDPVIRACSEADVMIIVGTAMQVYPAAVLYTFAPPQCRIFVINPVRPDLTAPQHVEYLDETAVEGMRQLAQRL